MKSWKARLLMGLMLVATLLIMVAGPAMAHDNDRDCINRDGDRFCEVNGDRHFDNGDFRDFDVEDFGFFPFFFFDNFGFVNDCPFAGDFEGPVNQFDCFD